jgi:hypothetical protein
MRACAICVLAVVMLGAVCAFAQDAEQAVVPNEQNLGAAGESCRARSDCRTGLRCIANVCRDEREGQTCGATSECGPELRCIANVCQSPLAASRPGAYPQSAWGPGAQVDRGDGSEEWFRFSLEGVHGFLGLSVMGGPVGLTVQGGGSPGGLNVASAFLFGLRGGVLIGHHELAFEISPMTFIHYDRAGGPTLQLNASYAYLAALYTAETFDVYWPLRVGIGMMAINTAGSLAFFQMRADLIGVAFRVGHLVIDLHLPSFRYDVSGQGGATAHYFYWLFGASVSYAF